MNRRRLQLWIVNNQQLRVRQIVIVIEVILHEPRLGDTSVTMLCGPGNDHVTITVADRHQIGIAHRPTHHFEPDVVGITSNSREPYKGVREMEGFLDGEVETFALGGLQGDALASDKLGVLTELPEVVHTGANVGCR